MFSEGDEGQQGLVLAIIFILVALVVALVIVVAVNHRKPLIPPAKGVGVASAAVSPVPQPRVPSRAPDLAAVQAAQAASDSASVTIERDVVKFYFASGRADLAADAGAALAGMVSAAKAGRVLVISGFHDATGDARKNAELARQRALAVRSALRALGVAEQQIDLKKSEQMAGNGSKAEARRVEITLR